MNEGWVCPRCDKVWAPSVKSCDCEPREWQPYGEVPLMPWPTDPRYPTTTGAYH